MKFSIQHGGSPHADAFKNAPLSRRQFLAASAAIGATAAFVPHDLLGAAEPRTNQSYSKEDQPTARPSDWTELEPSVWGPGQLLAFSALDGPTDYKHGLVARTRNSPAGLAIELPAPAKITVCGGRVERADIGNDFLALQGADGGCRALLVDAHHLLLEGQFLIESCSADLATRSEGTRTLIGSKEHYSPDLIASDLDGLLRSRRAWVGRHALPPGAPSGRRRTFAKALNVMKGQVCSPEGTIRRRWTTPDRWPHRDLWLWDSVFHAIGWRHLDAGLAREMIEAVLDGQHEDGFIPHQASPYGRSGVTQPPVLALGYSMLPGNVFDRDALAGVYPRLCRYLEWDFKHRDTDGAGLVEWLIEGDPNCRSGESGMDNSTRFDAAIALDAVDFNAFLASECAVMAGFARRLGKAEDAAMWQSRCERLNGLINERLWDEKRGFYFDCDPRTGQRTGIYAVSGFLPLLCGAADARRVARLAGLIADPAMFGTPVPLPTALPARGAPVEKDMWRGPMWVNTNWLVALGFERSGRPDVAKRLREQTLREIERRYVEGGSIYEFYDQTGELPPPALPRKGKPDPDNPYRQVIFDYGWSTTLYVDMVLHQ